MIRDTAKYRPYMKRRGTGSKLYPKSLKDLSSEILNETIQTGEHSSVEDAISVLKLYKCAAPQWEKYLTLRPNAGLVGHPPPPSSPKKKEEVVEKMPVLQLQPKHETFSEFTE